MKSFVLLAITGFILNYTYGQQIISIGQDCNPRLNEKEIFYLDSLFSKPDFDFRNKTIGFATLHPIKILGFINYPSFSSSPMDKKEYFSLISQGARSKNTSKLILLTKEQQGWSKGFDAIVLFMPKKKVDKVTDETADEISTVFGYRNLNYPDNLNLVGNDTNSVLNNEDAIFFNRIYQYKRNSFDFKDKKIAFMNPNESDKKRIIKTKREYIDKIKKHLENDFLYPSDFLYILNEEEKKESGGYDAIIIYTCKWYRAKDLIKMLKQNAT